MPYAPDDLADMHVAIRVWAVGILGEDYSVIWRAQDGPRPAFPYAELSVPQPPATVGGKPAETLEGDDDNPIARSEYDAELLARVELFSRDGLDPDSGMTVVEQDISRLEASLRTRTVLEALSAAGLAFVSSRTPLAIPTVVGFGHERRVRMDVVFRVRVRVDVEQTPVLDSTSFEESPTLSIADGVITGSIGTEE